MRLGRSKALITSAVAAIDQPLATVRAVAAESGNDQGAHAGVVVHVATEHDSGLQLVDLLLGRARGDTVNVERLAADGTGNLGLGTDGILQVGFDSVPEGLLLACLVLVVGGGEIVEVVGVAAAEDLVGSG
jgi:hypothetical protein